MVRPRHYRKDDSAPASVGNNHVELSVETGVDTDTRRDRPCEKFSPYRRQLSANQRHFEPLDFVEQDAVPVFNLKIDGYSRLGTVDKDMVARQPQLGLAQRPGRGIERHALVSHR